MNSSAGDTQAILGAVLGMGSCVDPVDDETTVFT